MMDDSEVQTTVDPLVGLPRVGHVVADKYRVTRLVGVGGMGVVLEAWHSLLEQKVAIKLLLPALGADEDALRRFEREGRTVVRIRSEHVAKVLDVGRLPNGTPYTVMEFLEGKDLAELCGGETILPIPVAVDHVLQACEAVAEAHSHGIVHRDLKPENVFVTMRADGAPCVKVLDFGLSKAPSVTDEDARPESAITASRQVMGTPNYMAPEQWDSAHDVGPAADQWALGAVLYELLCGTPAFGGTSLAMVCAKVTNMAPEPVCRRRADVPEALEQAIMRTLAKEPPGRYPSLFEFALAIAPFGSDTGRIALRRISGVLRPGAPPPEVGAASSASRAALPAAPASPPLTSSGPLQVDGGMASPEAIAPTALAWPPQLAAPPQKGVRRPALVVGFTLALLLGGGVALIALLMSRTESPSQLDAAQSEPSADSSNIARTDPSGSSDATEPQGGGAGDVGPTSVSSAEPTASSAESPGPSPAGGRTGPKRPKRSTDPMNIFRDRQ